MDQIKKLISNINKLKGVINPETIIGYKEEIATLQKSIRESRRNNKVGGGFSQVYHDATLSGEGTSLSPLTVISGGTGWTIETPTGSLYDQDLATGGLSFTSSTTATAVFVDGQTFFDGAGCTISGTSITLDNPATRFIRVAI